MSPRAHVFRGPQQPALLELTIGELLRARAAEHPHLPALIHGAEERDARRRWSYAELLDDVNRCARMLLERFTPGERVAVWAPNVPHWIVVQLALASAGLVMVSMNPAFRRAEALHALSASRASGIIVAAHHGSHPIGRLAAELAAELPQLRHVIAFEDLDELIAGFDADPPGVAVHPTSPAQIQFTSGTTGTPKGAVLHHRGVVNNAWFTAQRIGVRPGSVFIRPSLLYHVGGSVASSLMNLAGGGAIVPMARWNPDLAVRLIVEENGTVVGGVPTMMRALLEAAQASGADLSVLETVVLGAAPIPPELVEDLRAHLGIETVTMFGQTESGPTVTMTHRADGPHDTARTVGTLLPHTEVRIVHKDTRADLPPGEVGELLVRSPMLMAGYFDAEEQTAQTLDTEGWLRTGDLCAIDERGYVSVAGRTKELIIRGGANIYPREIEEALLSHPAVAEVAVVGVPDARLGEDIAAFVRITDGATTSAAQLRAHTESLLARAKVPARWFAVDAFPLTASGKIQKHVLQDGVDSATPLAEHDHPQPTASPATAAESKAGR